MKATRRDLFKFAAGGTVGLALTPMPWRLVTDTALWSENWPGIPRPLRGEIRTRFTHCTLCPAGCAVRARCVGDQPVSLRGLPGQPLCAFGLTGHHMPYHANRITRGDLEGAARAVRQALSRRRANESVAVLDLRPGRTVSWTYRRAMGAVPGGLYLAPQSGLAAIDLSLVKTILSFGVPVLDGWGTPGNVLVARSQFRLIQAEPVESHTAVLADEWLPLRPGSQDALASGIRHILSAGAAGIPSGEAAERTGLPKRSILAVAAKLLRGSAVVLAQQETEAVMALNRMLAGRAIVSRREAPVPAHWTETAAPVTAFTAVPDRSIRALLIDESVNDGYFPWEALERKLTPEATVVVFASSRAGYGIHAGFVLPAAVYPEIADDIPAATDSTAATLRLAAPLIQPPATVVEPARLVAELAGVDAGAAMRERADTIHQSGRGRVLSYTDLRSTPLPEMKADEFWKTLHDGGRWVDEAGGNSPVEPRACAPAVVAMTWEMRMARGPMSPLVTKLYQESNLRVRT